MRRLRKRESARISARMASIPRAGTGDRAVYAFGGKQDSAPHVMTQECVEQRFSEGTEIGQRGKLVERADYESVCVFAGLHGGQAVNQ